MSSIYSLSENRLYPVSPSLHHQGVPQDQLAFLEVGEKNRFFETLSAIPNYFSSKVGLNGFLLEAPLPLVPLFISFIKQCAMHGFSFKGPFIKGSTSYERILGGRELEGADLDFCIEGFDENFSDWNVIKHIFLACLARYTGITYLDHKIQDEVAGCTTVVRCYYRNGQEFTRVWKQPAWDAFLPVNFEDGLAYCGQFFISQNGLQSDLSITPNKENQEENHLLLSLPTKDSKIDICFLAKSKTLSFSSIDSPWIDCASTFETLNRLYPFTPHMPLFKEAVTYHKVQKALARVRVAVKTVDGYKMASTKDCIKARKYEVKDPYSVRDALKVHAYRIARGYKDIGNDKSEEAFFKNFIAEYFNEGRLILKREDETKFAYSFSRYVEGKPYLQLSPKYMVFYFLIIDTLFAKNERGENSILGTVSKEELKKIHLILASFIIKALVPQEVRLEESEQLSFLKYATLHMALHEGWPFSMALEPNFQHTDLLSALNKLFPLYAEGEKPLEYYAKEILAYLKKSPPKELSNSIDKPLSSFLAFYPFIPLLKHTPFFGEYLLFIFENHAESFSALSPEQKKEVLGHSLEGIKGFILKGHPLTAQFLRLVSPYLGFNEWEDLLAFFTFHYSSSYKEAKPFEQEILFSLAAYLYDKCLSIEGMLASPLESLVNTATSFISSYQEITVLIGKLEKLKRLTSFEEKLLKELKRKVLDSFIAFFPLKQKEGAFFLEGCALYKKSLMSEEIPLEKSWAFFKALLGSSLMKEEKYFKELFSQFYFAVHSSDKSFLASPELFSLFFEKASEMKNKDAILSFIWEKVKNLALKYQAPSRIQEQSLLKNIIIKLIKNWPAGVDKIFTEMKKIPSLKSPETFCLPSYLVYLFTKNKNQIVSHYEAMRSFIDALSIDSFIEVLSSFIEHMPNFKDPKAQHILLSGVKRIQGASQTTSIAKALVPHVKYLKLNKELKKELCTFFEQFTETEIPEHSSILEELEEKLDFTAQNPSFTSFKEVQDLCLLLSKKDLKKEADFFADNIKKLGDVILKFLATLKDKTVYESEIGGLEFFLRDQITKARDAYEQSSNVRFLQLYVYTSHLYRLKIKVFIKTRLKGLQIDNSIQPVFVFNLIQEFNEFLINAKTFKIDQPEYFDFWEDLVPLLVPCEGSYLAFKSKLDEARKMGVMPPLAILTIYRAVLRQMVENIQQNSSPSFFIVSGKCLYQEVIEIYQNPLNEGKLSRFLYTEFQDLHNKVVLKEDPSMQKRAQLSELFGQFKYLNERLESPLTPDKKSVFISACILFKKMLDICETADYSIPICEDLMEQGYKLISRGSDILKKPSVDFLAALGEMVQIFLGERYPRAAKYWCKNETAEALKEKQAGLLGIVGLIGSGESLKAFPLATFEEAQLLFLSLFRFNEEIQSQQATIKTNNQLALITDFYKNAKDSQVVITKIHWMTDQLKVLELNIQEALKENRGIALEIGRLSLFLRNIYRFHITMLNLASLRVRESGKDLSYLESAFSLLEEMEKLEYTPYDGASTKLFSSSSIIESWENIVITAMCNEAYFQIYKEHLSLKIPLLSSENQNALYKKVLEQMVTSLNQKPTPWLIKEAFHFFKETMKEMEYAAGCVILLKALENKDIKLLEQMLPLNDPLIRNVLWLGYLQIQLLYKKGLSESAFIKAYRALPSVPASLKLMMDYAEQLIVAKTAYFKGQYQKAFEIYKKFNEEGIAVKGHLATCLKSLKRYQEARTLFEEIPEVKTDPVLGLSLAEVYFHLEEWDLCIDYYMKCYLNNPDFSSESFRCVAKAYEKKHMWRAALNYYKPAYHAFKKDPIFLYDLAACNFQLKRIDEAKKNLNEALALDKKNPTFLALLEELNKNNV